MRGVYTHSPLRLYDLVREVTDCFTSLSFHSEAQQTLRYLICFGKANKPVGRGPLRSVVDRSEVRKPNNRTKAMF